MMSLIILVGTNMISLALSFNYLMSMNSFYLLTLVYDYLVMVKKNRFVIPNTYFFGFCFWILWQNARVS